MRVREHWCDQNTGAFTWWPGSVAACEFHDKPGSAGSVLPLAKRLRTVLEGVSKTGMVSKAGLMTKTEYFDGRESSVAQPRGIHYEWSISQKRLKRIDPKQIPFDPKEHRVRVDYGTV